MNVYADLWRLGGSVEATLVADLHNLRISKETLAVLLVLCMESSIDLVKPSCLPADESSKLSPPLSTTQKRQCADIWGLHPFVPGVNCPQGCWLSPLYCHPHALDTLKLTLSFP